MASNHTTNYQLNQWEKSDRILMADFNADNQKIDAAIAGRLGPIQTIKSMTIDAQSSSLLLDLSDIAWDKWSIIAIACDLGISDTTINRSMIVSFTSSTGSDSLRTSFIPNKHILTLFPCRDGSRPFAAAFFPVNGLEFGTASYQQITGYRIDFAERITVRAGSKISVYGIA